MTDTERERELRRLQFSKDLESKFQEDYYQRIVPALRVGLALMALVTAAQALVYFANPHDNAPLFSLLLIVRPLGILGTLGFTFWRNFWRYWQLYFAIVMALGCGVGFSLMGQSLAHTTFWRGPAAQLGYLTILTLYAMVILAGLLRLHFRWTVFCQIVLGLFSFQALLAYVRQPPVETITFYSLVILPSLVMVTFASYAHERFQRSAFLSNHLLDIERDKSETLLRNTLPDAIVDRLKASIGPIADDHAEVTVLFGDIAGFTPWATQHSAREVLDFLNLVFSSFDRLVDEYDLEKIKTVGDCYMVVAGAPTSRPDHVEAAARLALKMQAEVTRLCEEEGVPVLFRIGIHTGPLIAGVIGEKRFLYDVWGDTVNIASRLESHGLPGAIQVSAEVATQLRGRFILEPRGEIEIKGKGLVETYLLVAEELPLSKHSPTLQ